MKFSLKMGVRFAASLNMGEHFLHLLRLCMKMLGLTYNQYEDKGLVTNYGEGGLQNGRGGGHVNYYPYKNGGWKKF